MSTTIEVANDSMDDEHSLALSLAGNQSVNQSVSKSDHIRWTIS